MQERTFLLPIKILNSTKPPPRQPKIPTITKLFGPLSLLTVTSLHFPYLGGFSI